MTTNENSAEVVRHDIVVEAELLGTFCTLDEGVLGTEGVLARILRDSLGKANLYGGLEGCRGINVTSLLPGIL